MRKHMLNQNDYRMEIDKASFPDAAIGVTVLNDLLFKSHRLLMLAPAGTQDFYVTAANTQGAEG